MMKKKVILILLFLTAAVSVVVLKPSLAWFFDSGSDKSQLIDIAKFDVALTKPCDIRSAYTAGSDNYVAPGENMIYIEETENVWVNGSLSVMNKSTITTNIRVKIQYSRLVGENLVTTTYGDSTNDFQVKDASGTLITVSPDWDYDVATKCWLYKPVDDTQRPYDISIPTDPVSGDEIVLLSSMGYSDQLEQNNTYKNKTVTVALKVEAKQAEYATWTQVLTP